MTRTVKGNGRDMSKANNWLISAPRVRNPVIWNSRSRAPGFNSIARAMTLPSLGRSAAELISINKRFSSSCAPLDKLLGGGLPSGHVLELSGPPGTTKEILSIKFASSAVSSNEQVLFVGKIPTQRQFLSFLLAYQTCKTWPAQLRYIQSFVGLRAIHLASISRWLLLGSKNLNDASLELVQYLNIFTLPDFLIFLHNLPSFLEAHASVNGFAIIYQVLTDRGTPQIRLVILNSIWFPFQTAPDLTYWRKTTLLLHVRQVLARLCSSLDIAVIPQLHVLKSLSPTHMTWGTGCDHHSASHQVP